MIVRFCFILCLITTVSCGDKNVQSWVSCQAALSIACGICYEDLNGESGYYQEQNVPLQRFQITFYDRDNGEFNLVWPRWSVGGKAVGLGIFHPREVSAFTEYLYTGEDIHLWYGENVTNPNYPIGENLYSSHSNKVTVSSGQDGGELEDWFWVDGIFYFEPVSSTLEQQNHRLPDGFRIRACGGIIRETTELPANKEFATASRPHN